MIFGAATLFSFGAAGCTPSGTSPSGDASASDVSVAKETTQASAVCCTGEGDCLTAPPGECPEGSQESGFGTCEDHGCPVPGFIGLNRSGAPRKALRSLRAV